MLLNAFSLAVTIDAESHIAFFLFLLQLVHEVLEKNVLCLPLEMSERTAFNDLLLIQRYEMDAVLF